MFEKMRRQDKQLSLEETKDILSKGVYGVLSMNGERPYGVPLNYVYKDGCIYFHSALEGKKLVHARTTKYASFCVVNEAVPMPNAFNMKYESAIVFGPISEINGDEKMSALVSLIDKYATSDDYRIRGREYAKNSFDETVVLKMDIEHLTGKAKR